MDQRINDATIDRFVEAHLTGKPDGLAAELHPEVTVWWPQSGERIKGKANVDAINRAMPDGHPKGRLLRRRVIGDLAILELELTYGTDCYYVVELVELRDGKVIHATEYFGAPFEAPAWRAGWVERE
jgi:hypothetical protein